MAKNEQKSPDSLPLESKDAAPVALILDLAMKHGKTFHRVGKDGNMYPTVPGHDSPFKQEHMQADVLHGWTKHERHTSEFISMSDEDYLAAIEAAKLGKTHAPANKRTAEEAARAQASRDAAKKGA